MVQKPKLIRDWAGGYVRSMRIIRNGYGEMPAGTVYKIQSAGITAHFMSLPCPCCGFKFSFSSKSRHKFDDMEWLGYNKPPDANRAKQVVEIACDSPDYVTHPES